MRTASGAPGCPFLFCRDLRLPVVFGAGLIVMGVDKNAGPASTERAYNTVLSW